MSEMSGISQKIAYDTNCPVCRAGLYQLKNKGWVYCDICLGTGRDPIPWAELFRVGARYW